MNRVLVLLLTVVAALAMADPTIYMARANNTAGEPAAITSAQQYLDIWAEAEPLTTNEITFLNDNDGSYYVRQATEYTWHWIMVRFKSSEKDHNHLAAWEGYTDSYDDWAMEVYVWDHVNTEFDSKDTSAERTIWTKPRTYYVEPAYWVWEETMNGYECMILIQVRTEAGNRAMHIDVVKQGCP